MTLTETENLASLIAARVREVPGVNYVYSAKPLAEQIVTTVTQLVTRKPGLTDLVSVSQTENAVKIAVCVGVTPDEPAGAVCKRVYDAVDQFVSNRTSNLARHISITIGSVH